MDSFASLLSVNHEEFGQLALAANAGAEGLVVVPYFEGERTPNLPQAKGAVLGLTLSNNRRENLARAAIEGMLCGLADGLEVLLAQGVACERVLLIGGAAANAAVQKIASEIFGVQVDVPNLGEYVADGAARQAAWALTGANPSWEVSMLAKINSEPRPEILAQYRAQVERLNF
jgi:xylulokinase